MSSILCAPWKLQVILELPASAPCGHSSACLPSRPSGLQERYMRWDMNLPSLPTLACPRILSTGTVFTLDTCLLNPKLKTRVILMKRPSQASRCPWLILAIGIVGLSTSAYSSAISADATVKQQFTAVGKSVLGGLRHPPSISSNGSKGLSICPLAYVDPGSGQLIWQMVVAACVGALFYIKRFRTFLANLFAKWFKKKD